jgi:hypothetical protein
LNPNSTNFILRVAWIPRDGFFNDKMNDLNTRINSKFTILNQIGDCYRAISNSSYQDSTWGGIKMQTPEFLAQFFGQREFTVVDPTFINYIAPKVRFWFSGLILLYMLFFTAKTISRVVNS